MLLFCFVAGQYVVYAHRHADSTGTYHKSACQNPNSQPKQTVTENCQLCDVMHHNAMAVNSVVYFAPVTVSQYFYKAISHHFISISLVLAAGRAPPLA